MSPEISLALKFISGKIKLLKYISSKVIIIPNKIGARIIVIKPMPDARIAFISLSSDNLPKVIRVASKTDIGTESAKIQARFKNKYSSIVIRSNPLPKNLSMALSKKFTKRMKVIINREKINGSTSSFKKYLYKSLTPKVTYLIIIISIEFLLEIN